MRQARRGAAETTPRLEIVLQPTSADATLMWKPDVAPGPFPGLHPMERQREHRSRMQNAYTSLVLYPSVGEQSRRHARIGGPAENCARRRQAAGCWGGLRRGDEGRLRLA